MAARRTRFVWAGEHLVREVTEHAAWDATDAASAQDNPTLVREDALAAVLLGGAAPPETVWHAAEARDYAYWPGTASPFLLRVSRPAADADAPNAPAESATYLYHCDHLGAPVRLTDAAGRVVWEAAYAPYGAARLTVAEVAQPWRRPGQYADAETGLCYNRLRYYDPGLGRYLTPDPAGLLGGSHAYRYARNAPTWEADPLGLWPSWGTVAAIAASVVVGIAVVALAPIALPLAILAAGVAAGATFGFLNEGLNNDFGCPRPSTRTPRFRRSRTMIERASSELDPGVHEQVTALAEAGDGRATVGDYVGAVKQYNAAWRLLPEPKNDWEAATWLLAAIGDCSFQAGYLTSARKALEYAMTCPGGGRESVFAPQAGRGLLRPACVGCGVR